MICLADRGLSPPFSTLSGTRHPHIPCWGVLVDGLNLGYPQAGLEPVTVWLRGDNVIRQVYRQVKQIPSPTQSMFINHPCLCSRLLPIQIRYLYCIAPLTGCFTRGVEILTQVGDCRNWNKAQCFWGGEVFHPL